MKLSFFLAASTLFAANVLFAGASASKDIAHNDAHAPERRRVQEEANLEDKWYVDNLDVIEDPEVEGQFILEGQTGRNGQFPQHGVRIYLFWTDFALEDPVAEVCPFESGKPNVGTLAAYHPTSADTMAAHGLDRIAVTVDGPNHRTEMKFSINDNILTSPIFRQIDGENGIIRFCAHYSMMRGGATISFRDLAVQMSINLDGSFDVADIQTERFAITEDWGLSQTFGVSASNCGDDLVYFPGEPIRICVCANNWPATSIVDFVSMNFAGISGSAIADPEMTQDITGCVGGVAGPQECCEVNTVLAANQYPAVVGATATKTFVGEVTMAIGNGGQRRLVTQTVEVPTNTNSQRKLEDGRQTFETEVVLINSAASASYAVGGWMASVGVAAMMMLWA